MSRAPQRMNSQQVVRLLFSLPDEEDVLDDFSCGLRKKVLIHGRLFCTDNFLCFYANILGFKTKQVIPFRDVIAIRRHKGSITNSIEVACANKKSFFFGSFTRRNEAFQFIYSLWRNSGYCDESQDTGVWSDDEDPPPTQEEEEKEGITMLPTEDEGDRTETLKAILPITPKKFFELFFADDAVYPFKDYCMERKDTEFEITSWVENEELGGWTREIKFRTKINGPSIGPKTTRCHRTQVYKWADGNLIIKTSSKALDVPYSSYFVVEDEWNVTANGADKCIFRCLVSINFLKSTMFKGTIEGRSKTDVAADHENWLKSARAKCLGDAPSPTEKQPEKQIHPIAKYDEVDLKAYRQKTKMILNSAPNSVNSLLLFNTICIILLFFYLSHLFGRLNELSNRGRVDL